LPLTTGVTGTLPVANGGTGVATIGANGMLLGAGTGAVTTLAPGTTGNVATSNGTIWTSAAPSGGGMTLGTLQATTSGTSFNFGSIPAGTKIIFVNFNGVSLSGTETIYVQLGDAGGIEVTGYNSTSAKIQNGISPATDDQTVGFNLWLNSATSLARGQMILTLMNTATFLWAASFSGFTRTNEVMVQGGNKALSAELTQVTVTRSGADTFDAGSVNILYM
jgi:hypothetical protein